MVEYGPYLEALFVDANRLMWQLSDNEDGYFTNYDFLRKTGQKYQGAYVRFLAAVLEDRSGQYLFNLVHQAIGKELSRRAQALGYKKEDISDKDEVNIWGDKTSYVVYRRTAAVRQQ